MDKYFRGVSLISEIGNEQSIDDLHEFKFDELLVNKELIEVFVRHINQEVYQPALR